MIDAPFVLLERKVLLRVLVKIKRLGFDRNSLDGIVAELAAFAGCEHYAPFGTQSHSVIQHCAKATVCTGFLDFLTKQHIAASFVCSEMIIHQPTTECYPYFSFSAELL